MLCRDTVKDESGRVNVDKILQKVTPEARRLVPDAVKMELLQKIKTIINKQLEITDEDWTSWNTSLNWDFDDFFIIIDCK